MEKNNIKTLNINKKLLSGDEGRGWRKKVILKFIWGVSFFLTSPAAEGGVVGHSIRVSKNNIKLYSGPSPPVY